MSLIELQRDMRNWLIREDRWAARRLGDDAAPGLRVYLNNYRAQLVACLEDSFARTHDWLGDAAFRQAVIAHIERVPPSSWTLDAYSRDFPATLALLYPDAPEVAELAWIDCALGEAFVGPDAPAADAAMLGDVDWDSATLQFTPTLDVGDLSTNAPAIWSALAAGDLPPARSGLSFAAMCDGIGAALGHEKGIALAGQLLGQWLADGLITKIEERPVSI